MFVNDLSSTIVWPWCVSWNKKDLQLTEVCVSTSCPGSCFLFAAATTSRPQPRRGLGMLNMWPWQILLWRWATTPTRKQKAWWWKQFSEGTIVSLSTSSDQAISCFLIYAYFCLLSVNLEEASHHRNPVESELSNQVSILLWWLRWQRHRRDGATATPAPQVAGDS
jgi:hypothetical protein